MTFNQILNVSVPIMYRIDLFFFFYYYCYFFFTEGRQDMQKLRTEHSIDSFANCHEMRIYLLGC